jgi:type I restriction enzyme S subunit
MTGNLLQTTLGSVLEFANGRASPARVSGNPYPVYGSNGIIGYASEANADEATIVIGRVGSYCGSLYFAKDRCWVTDNAIRATALGDNDPRYLFYLLNTLALNNWRAGSGQPLLNQDILSRIPISIPDAVEQRAIAAILGALDDKIELNRRMNETLEAMARAIFKSWFVDFEPVRAKMDGRWRRGQSLPGLPADLYDLFPDSFEDSELGKIPSGWRTGTFGEIADNPRIGVSPEQIPDGAVYVGLEHIPKRSIALDSWGTSDGLESGKFRFSAGDVLFGKLRPYFHKVAVAPESGVCSTDILVIRPKSSEWGAFTICLASSTELVEYASALADGTRMPRTNWHDLARYETVLPPAAVAAVFDRHTVPLIQSIEENIRESRTLAAIRDALLPKLISGEIRLQSSGQVAEALRIDAVGDRDL